LSSDIPSKHLRMARKHFGQAYDPETLKVLGAPDADLRPVDKLAIKRLVAAKLSEMQDGRPIITPMGRKAVVRGSPSLWDTSG